MKNKILAALLLLPVVGLGGGMLYYEKMTHFDRVEIAVRGYDPKDFFSGYYMRLQPDWQKTDCTQFADKRCPQNDFAKDYTFYMKQEHSGKLSTAVNAGDVKLVFSYSASHMPLIVDLLVDGQTYMEYVTDGKK